MEDRADSYFKDVRELADRMQVLADEAELRVADQGCLLLCGRLRDYSFELRRQVAAEAAVHALAALAKARPAVTSAKT